MVTKPIEVGRVYVKRSMASRAPGQQVGRTTRRQVIGAGDVAPRDHRLAGQQVVIYRQLRTRDEDVVRIAPLKSFRRWLKDAEPER